MQTWTKMMSEQLPTAELLRQVPEGLRGRLADIVSIGGGIGPHLAQVGPPRAFPR
jgi:hypothetical protein